MEARRLTAVAVMLLWGVAIPLLHGHGSNVAAHAHAAGGSGPAAAQGHADHVGDGPDVEDTVSSLNRGPHEAPAAPLEAGTPVGAAAQLTGWAAGTALPVRPGGRLAPVPPSTLSARGSPVSRFEVLVV